MANRESIIGPGEVLHPDTLYQGSVLAAYSCAAEGFRTRLESFGLWGEGSFARGPEPTAMMVAQVGTQYRTSFLFRVETERLSRFAQQQIGLSAFDVGAQPVSVELARVAPGSQPSAPGGAPGIFSGAANAVQSGLSAVAETTREVARTPLYLALLGAVGLAIYFTVKS